MTRAKTHGPGKRARTEAGKSKRAHTPVPFDQLEEAIDALDGPPQAPEKPAPKAPRTKPPGPPPPKRTLPPPTRSGLDSLLPDEPPEEKPASKKRAVTVQPKSSLDATLDSFDQSYPSAATRAPRAASVEIDMSDVEDAPPAKPSTPAWPNLAAFDERPPTTEAPTYKDHVPPASPATIAATALGSVQAPDDSYPPLVGPEPLAPDPSVARRTPRPPPKRPLAPPIPDLPKRATSAPDVAAVKLPPPPPRPSDARQVPPRPAGTASRPVEVERVPGVAIERVESGGPAAHRVADPRVTAGQRVVGEVPPSNSRQRPADLRRPDASSAARNIGELKRSQGAGDPRRGDASADAGTSDRRSDAELRRADAGAADSRRDEGARDIGEFKRPPGADDRRAEEGARAIGEIDARRAPPRHDVAAARGDAPASVAPRGDASVKADARDTPMGGDAHRGHARTAAPPRGAPGSVAPRGDAGTVDSRGDAGTVDSRRDTSVPAPDIGEPRRPSVPAPDAARAGDPRMTGAQRVVGDPNVVADDPRAARDPRMTAPRAGDSRMTGAQRVVGDPNRGADDSPPVRGAQRPAGGPRVTGAQRVVAPGVGWAPDADLAEAVADAKRAEASGLLKLSELRPPARAPDDDRRGDEARRRARPSEAPPVREQTRADLERDLAAAGQRAVQQRRAARPGETQPLRSEAPRAQRPSEAPPLRAQRPSEAPPMGDSAAPRAARPSEAPPMRDSAARAARPSEAPPMRDGAAPRAAPPPPPARELSLDEALGTTRGSRPESAYDEIGIADANGAPRGPEPRPPPRREISVDEGIVVDRHELPQIRTLAIAIHDTAAQLVEARTAIKMAGHNVAALASGAAGIEQVKTLLRAGGVDALLVAIPGGEELVDTALALSARRPVVIAACDGDALEVVRRAGTVGADLAVARPFDIERLAPVLLAASRLCEERHTATSAKGSESLLRARLDALVEPEPGALQPFELFQRVLELELKRARRYNYPIAVALFAVEIAVEPPPGVRGILRARAGNALIHSIRDIDLATEVDQERFLVLLPYTTLTGAAEVARRIIGAVNGGDPVTAAGRTFPPKLVGAVAGAQPGQPLLSFSKLMRDATQALEQARRDGAELAVPVIRGDE